MRAPLRVDIGVRPSTVWRLTLQLVGVGAVAYVLVHARAVLVWILIALILALALEPAVAFLQRRSFGRGLAVGVVITAIVTLLVALFATLVPLLVDQAEALVSAIPSWIERLRASESFSWANERFHLIDTMTDQVAGAARTAAGPAVALIGGVFFTLAGIVTVVVLTAFMLLFGPPVLRGIFAWVEPRHRKLVVDLVRRSRKAVGGFVAGSLVVASIGGVATGATLLALGVPYWVALGLVMIVLGLIPYIGPIIGAVLVVGTAFLSSGSRAGWIALGVLIAYQQLENHLLQPLVQRRTIRMNPLIIAISMLIGTAIAGIAGALLALPVASAAQVVLRSALLRRRRSRRRSAGFGTRPCASAERRRSAHRLRARRRETSPDDS